MNELITVDELNKRLMNVQIHVREILSKTKIKVSSKKNTEESPLNDRNTLFAELLLIITYKICKDDESYKDESLKVSLDIDLGLHELVTKSRCSGIENHIKNYIGGSTDNFIREDKSPTFTKTLNKYKFIYDVLIVLKTIKADTESINYYYEFKNNKRKYELELSYSIDELTNLLNKMNCEYQLILKNKEGKKRNMTQKMSISSTNSTVSAQGTTYNTYSTESVAEYIAEQLDPFLEILTVEIEEKLHELFNNSNFIFLENLDVLHLGVSRENCDYPVDLAVVKTASQKIYLFVAEYSIEKDEFTFDFLKCVDKHEFFDYIQDLIGTLEIEYLQADTFESLQRLINII